jgi:hypothetical protein
MIRALEIREEDEAKRTTLDIIVSLQPNDRELAKITCEYLDYFLALQQEFDHTDARVLAALTIRIVLLQRGVFESLQTLMDKLSAPRPKNLEKLFDIAAKNLYSWGSCLILFNVLKPFPMSLQRGITAVQGSEMTHHIWREMAGQSLPNGSVEHWEHQKRYMAACLEYTFRQYQLHLPVDLDYETLLDMVGEQKDLMQDLVVQSPTRRFIGVGIDWTREA